MKVLLYTSLFLFICIHQTFAQSYTLSGVAGNGATSATDGSFTLNATVGQPLIGSSTSTLHQINSGFWHGFPIITSTGEEELLPAEFRLEQNYPNPFNPETAIKFSVRERCNVSIKIYGILGSELTVLVNEEMEPGWYFRTFNAGSYASGVYILRMEAGNYISSKKMLLIK